jgi:hypothetical protein
MISVRGVEATATAAMPFLRAAAAVVVTAAVAAAVKAIIAAAESRQAALQPNQLHPRQLPLWLILYINQLIRLEKNVRPRTSWLSVHTEIHKCAQQVKHVEMWPLPLVWIAAL